MADEEAEGEEGEGEEGDSKNKGDHKKTWEEIQQEKLMKNRNKFMPWGSDPCVRMRIRLGQVPKNELLGIKGASFPWYKKTVKAMDVAKKNEKKANKERKRQIKANEEAAKACVKRHREYLTNLSQKVHCRRLFEANKDPDCNMTYEEYIARLEKQKRLKEKIEKEDEKLRKEEEEEVRKQEEEIETRKQKKLDGEPYDEKKEKKDKKTSLEVWPGKYPTSVTQDFITMLKYIIEAEYETQQAERKKRAKKPLSKKDRLVKEFESFLGVLFTANELWKNCGSGDKGVRKIAIPSAGEESTIKEEESEVKVEEPPAAPAVPTEVAAEEEPPE